MAEDIEEEKEWTSGPTDTTEGLNSMVKTINKLIKKVKELEKKNQPVNVVVWNPSAGAWMNLATNGTPGGEATEPDVNCICECVSGAAESFGEVP